MDNHRPEQNSSSAEFTPPRHWLGPEELEKDYWNNPEIREKRGQEFFDKPIEAISLIDKVDTKGIARRDFLTVMGASMAMASFSCARRPVHKIIPYVVRPEEIVPGVPNFYASTCRECSTNCGVLVKTREGRPIKLEGNPDHPMNQGSLCARGQASVLNLYDTDRLKNPLVRDRVANTSKDVSWADADASIQNKLKAVAAGSGRVRVLSGEVQSPTTERLIREFLSGFSNGVHVQYEPTALEELAIAQGLSYGGELFPRYRFDQAEMVVTFGADFIGGWLSPLAYGKAWSKNRKLSAKNASGAKLSKMIAFESMITVTGSNADERYPIRPGDELKVAMAIAHELIINQKVSRFANDSAVTSVLASYKPEAVAQEIGIEKGAEKFRAIARELWNARGKSLVVGGGLSSKTKEAVALQIAVNLLNSALENEGTTVDGTVETHESKSRFADLMKLASDMKAGQVDVLIVYRSNPMYTAPRTALGLDEGFKKVPLVVVVSDREDETAKMADFVLADDNALENWGDANPRRGIYSLQQPTISPIHSTRAFEDSLLTWIKGAGLKASNLATKSADWHEYLQGSWEETVYRQNKVGGNFVDFWEGALRSGVFTVKSITNAKSSVRSFRAASVASLPKYAPQGSDAMYIALYEKVSMGDGRSANNPWLQEMPDPISAVSWDNYVNVGSQAAKKLNLAENDVVEVQVGDVTAQLPVHVQPGMHPGSIGVAVGYGRRAVGKVGNLAGVDVYPMVSIEGDSQVFSGRQVTLRKTGKFYRLASTQYHTATESRPFINDITLAEFRKNPAAQAETNPELRMEEVPTIWPKHEYKGYRWGMTIDLNSCTGCGACVIACQAENNVPVVGRDQVRNARNMQWIRIDRYYSGSVENPEVIFQPMLCQHCENAPCETVCPVLATVHDDEGLNVQVYNRCVGTRYCQNNCPYKVRRFNFFDHWKSYEGTMNLAWNPDVTVRTRGIMEKCTFCVQRIREGKDKAKDQNTRVHDGDIKTACQQTCPTDAIVFGDVNSQEAMVTKLRDARAFHALENLNTVPAISYLSKVRNVEKENS